MITNCPDLFELAMEMPTLILDAEDALRAGTFDDDPAARAEAVQCIAAARRFYSELLQEAWPENTTLQPHDEAIKQ